jgi:signal transduction histidine kinase
VLFPDVVAVVFRRLRELADASRVELRTDEPLPGVEVNAAAIELCLANYISNAVKYSDPHKRTRWARVSASVELQDAARDRAELEVRVSDNGMGVPPRYRDRLFDRYFRGHESVTAVEGTGLGLNLVRETGRARGPLSDPAVPGVAGVPEPEPDSPP